MEFSFLDLIRRPEIGHEPVDMSLGDPDIDVLMGLSPTVTDRSDRGRVWATHLRVMSSYGSFVTYYECVLARERHLARFRYSVGISPGLPNALPRSLLVEERVLEPAGIDVGVVDSDEPECRWESSRVELRAPS